MTITIQFMRKSILILLAMVIAFSVSCEKLGASKAPISRPGNLLTNPSFEEDFKGWYWLDWSKVWGPFNISDKVRHTGRKSAYIKIDERPGSPSKKIHGVVQTLKPDKFPKIAAGWYRIENWKRGVPRQYLQFVVIAWQDYEDNPNFQLRYVLAGVTQQPLPISNARYTILANGIEPETDKWIYFEVNIRDDFQKLWGKIPDNYSKLDFFWEARFDDDPAGAAHIRADAYYDDLYVGEGQ